MADGLQEVQQLCWIGFLSSLSSLCMSLWLIWLFRFNCTHRLAVHLVRVDRVWQIYRLLSLEGKQHCLSQTTYACTAV